MKPIRASIVALITPMHEDGSIDYSALRRLIDWHIEQGTDCIGVVGTTGESPTVSVQEHLDIIRVCVEQAKGRIPIMAGCGANSTAEAIELARYAQKVGAHSQLQVVPYYNRPTQEGQYLHFKKIIESVALPMYLYNVPGRTVADMAHDTVMRLAEVDGIVGIKEATGDLERGRKIIDQCPQGFAVYSGDDATARELMLLGGKGDISVTANVAPKLMSEMCAAALSGDRDRALQLDSRLAPLHSSLFVEANPIPVKWAVSELGLLPNALRLPMTPLSASHHEVVRAAMRSAELV